MQLCQSCNSANGSSFALGQCHLCNGKAMETDRMIEESAALLSKEEAASFSISTSIPKEWLVREEDVWDIGMRNARSVKDQLNRKISSALQRASSLPYNADGDCRLVFDYQNCTVRLERNELFIFGRYRKLVVGLSQSRWLCAKCEGKGCKACEGKGKNYESVEERIGEPVKRAAEAADYVLHASGREDVDATNTAGRAFVLEIKNPKKRKFDLDSLAGEIAATKEVSVSDLMVVRRSDVELVTESHFDKEYEAEVEFGKELAEKDTEAIGSLSGITILQQTPKRVAHRRANLVRHRKVKSLAVERSGGKSATIKIMAEAGTYIKELISGDGGRTKPSIAELLGTTAECRKLNVSKIDDGFLDFILKQKEF